MGSKYYLVTRFESYARITLQKTHARSLLHEINIMNSFNTGLIFTPETTLYVKNYDL